MKFVNKKEKSTILQRRQVGTYKIVGSNILDLEIERMRDIEKKRKVENLYRVTSIYVCYTENIKRRSQEMMKLSKIKVFDSLHIAAAEEAKEHSLFIMESVGQQDGLKLDRKSRTARKFEEKRRQRYGKSIQFRRFF